MYAYKDGQRVDGSQSRMISDRAPYDHAGAKASELAALQAKMREQSPTGRTALEEAGLTPVKDNTELAALIFGKGYTPQASGFSTADEVAARLGMPSDAYKQREQQQHDAATAEHYARMKQREQQMHTAHLAASGTEDLHRRIRERMGISEETWREYQQRQAATAPAVSATGASVPTFANSSAALPRTPQPGNAATAIFSAPITGTVVQLAEGRTMHRDVLAARQAEAARMTKAAHGKAEWFIDQAGRFQQRAKG